MHESMNRLLTYAKKATSRSASPVKSFADIGARLGESSATMTNWKSRGISKAGAIKAEHAFGCSVNWLLTGENEPTEPWPFVPGDRQDGVESGPIPLDNNPDYPAIPMVSFKLSAGVTGFGIEIRGETSKPIVFGRDWYRSRGFDPAKLYAITVAGSSMEPGLYEGDTVVVNTGQATPKDGVVFAANYEGELVIKRMVRDEGDWWLTSDNQDQRRFPRKRCHDTVIVLGEIVHKQSERI